MFEPLTQRRYLVPFKASRLPQQFTDVLVIGGGVAGLRAAIAAAERAEVLLLTKDTIDQSNTWYAQGGIAAVLQPLDSIESHVRTPKNGGAGLCDDEAVDIVVEEGPQRVLELLSLGHRTSTRRPATPTAWRSRARAATASRASSTPTATRPARELAQTLINTVRERENRSASPRTAFCIDLHHATTASASGCSR